MHRLLHLVPLLFAAFLLVVLADKEHTKHGAPSTKLDAELNKKNHGEHLDHQAILGSEKTAHEFDELSSEESKKRLRVLAKKMDKNGDGSVSIDELEAWIYQSLISLDKEETEERFDEIDSDKDGFITWGEYMHEAFGVEPGHEAQKFLEDPDDLKLMKEDRKYFGAADTNNDMQLSQEEFAAFQNPEHSDHMHSILVENTMVEKDLDKDGRINLKEFLGDTFEQPNSEWYATEKVRFTDEYDVDKDGFLSGEEVKHWLIPDIHHTARQEAEHLFKAADNDQNNALSIEEVVQAYKAFVGSEATNYGEKLVEMTHEEL